MVYLSIVVVFSTFLASNTSEVSYFLFFFFLKKLIKLQLIFVILVSSFIYMEIVWESLEKFLVNMCGQFPICVVVSEKQCFTNIISTINRRMSWLVLNNGFYPFKDP